MFNRGPAGMLIGGVVRREIDQVNCMFYYGRLCLYSLL
jgi:hypothetical protein